MLAELSLALLCGFNVTVVHPETSAPQFQVKVHHAPKAVPIESPVADILMKKDVPPAPPVEPTPAPVPDDGNNPAPCDGCDEKKKAENPKSKTKKENYLAYTPAWEGHVGGQTSKRHLIQDHHLSPSQLEGLSPAELNGLHGKMHGTRLQQSAVSKPPQAVQGNCANGQCAAPQRFFRRRR